MVFMDKRQSAAGGLQFLTLNTQLETVFSGLHQLTKIQIRFPPSQWPVNKIFKSLSHLWPNKLWVTLPSETPNKVWL